MTKTLIAFATAILAATTFFASTAEAGMRVRLGFGFPIGSFTAHGNSSGYSEPRHRHHHYVRREAPDDVAVTKKSASKSVAKAEPDEKVEKDDVAQSENSSISTASLAPVEAEPVADPSESKSEEEPKSAKKLDCKKFFPSVGMTLTVPCD
jgi:hypothetical protein